MFISGQHGRPNEPARFQSRNPLIRVYLEEHLALQVEIEAHPTYQRAVLPPPKGASVAVIARCYVTQKQASQLMRNWRRSAKRRQQTRRHLIVDNPTILSGAHIHAQLASIGTCSVKLPAIFD